MANLVFKGGIAGALGGVALLFAVSLLTGIAIRLCLGGADFPEDIDNTLEPAVVLILAALEKMLDRPAVTALFVQRFQRQHCVHRGPQVGDSRLSINPSQFASP